MTMLITLRPDCDARDVRQELTALGLWTERLDGHGGAAAFAVGGHSAPVDTDAIRDIAGVADVLLSGGGHPLVDAQAGRSIRLGGDVRIGGGAGAVLFAGPCAAESADQVARAAAVAAAAGARVLRGGAFKPRTSPYSFQGAGVEALSWLRAAADAHGMLVCTEVMHPEDVPTVAAVADVVQIGTRNMQNFALLKAAGAAGKPVLLKRGMASRISEWLLAGEHLLAAGAAGVVFCERGIVGFDEHTRNLLDLGAVAVLKHQYRQPVIADPSHAAGRRDLIAPLAQAALAAGADGLILETHPNPAAAQSDGPQALPADAMIALGQALLGRPATAWAPGADTRNTHPTKDAA